MPTSITAKSADKGDAVAAPIGGKFSFNVRPPLRDSMNSLTTPKMVNVR